MKRNVITLFNCKVELHWTGAKIQGKRKHCEKVINYLLAEGFLKPDYVILTDYE